MKTIPIQVIRGMIKEIRDCYPEDIFQRPVYGKPSPPDCYTAAGCRMVLDRLNDDINEYLEENNDN